MKSLTRTERQNRALHKYCSMVAEELRNGGFSVQMVLKHKLDVEWNPALVKELLWRTVQRTLVGKNSTKELKKVGEVDEVYEHLNRHLGEKFGIFVEFPHYENEEAYIAETTTLK